MPKKVDNICHYSGLPSLATYKKDYVYDKMLVTSINCYDCSGDIKIKIEPIDGLAMKNEYCNWCKKNVHIAFEIRNGMLVNLKVQ